MKSVCQIVLNKGLICLVDETDFEFVTNWTWTAIDGRGGRWYAHRWFQNNNVRRSVYLHRLLAGNPVGMKVDHWNGNTLDNRRENLRVCTNQQNSCNQRVKVCKVHSQYKGVTWDKSREKWTAKISPQYKTINLGRFDSEIEAARKYDEAALKFFGPFALLNFPETMIGSD